MADANQDGLLSFEEFKNWYSSEAGQAVNSRNNASKAPTSSTSNDSKERPSESEDLSMSLSVARTLTGLGASKVHDIFEMLANSADDEGLVPIDGYIDCFTSVFDQARTTEEHNRLKQLFYSIFELFDTDTTGKVDFAELSSGISVLCGGSSDDKVRSAFALFDFNGDGYISLTEFTTYLAAVYKVMYLTTPGTRERIGATPEELAKITAEEAFYDADLNLDGRLSFAEFKKWFASAGFAREEVSDSFENSNSKTSSMLDEEEPEASIVNWDMRSVREATKIDRFSPNDLFDVFTESSSLQEDGSHALGRDSFMQCAHYIVTLGGGSKSADDAELCGEFFTLVADSFTDSNTGMIDPRAVASGLSVLCNGPRDDKVRAAFDLFDINGDGFISKAEMHKYLTAVFRVLYVVTPSMEKQLNGVDAATLGTVTTDQAFLQCDINKNGRLSFEEFKKWYNDTGPL